MPSYKDLLKYDGEKDLYTWPKYSQIKISDHFTTDEFACPCHEVDCNEQMISGELVRRLENCREELGDYIKINSGYRCPKHQMYLKEAGLKTAVGISTHEQGLAADVRSPMMKDLEFVLSKHFKALGVARSFIHVDLRDDKIRRWKY